MQLALWPKLRTISVGHIIMFTWYEKDTNAYHKAVHVDAPDGSIIHRSVGTRLPKMNSYAYSSVGDGKTSAVTIEHQPPEKAHWRTTHFNADGKIPGEEYGQAIPSKRPGKRKNWSLKKDRYWILYLRYSISLLSFLVIENQNKTNITKMCWHNHFRASF